MVSALYNFLTSAVVLDLVATARAMGRSARACSSTNSPLRTIKTFLTGDGDALEGAILVLNILMDRILAHLLLRFLRCSARIKL